MCELVVFHSVKYYQNCVKFACNYFKNSSASGDFVPPDLYRAPPLDPAGGLPCPGPLWFCPPSQNSFRRLCHTHIHTYTHREKDRVNFTKLSKVLYPPLIITATKRSIVAVADQMATSDCVITKKNYYSTPVTVVKNKLFIFMVYTRIINCRSCSGLHDNV